MPAVIRGGAVLILGGTAEARELARRLSETEVAALTSLAGRVARPALPVGRVRIGGFGGVDGLMAFLRAEPIMAVIDATHPFAEQISDHAFRAAVEVGIPLLRLHRPGWREHPDASGWRWVPDTAAALVAADSARRPFVTTGRQSLASYLPWADRAVLARVVDPPEFVVPPAWTLVTSRGPYRLDLELETMRAHGADALVTKDSGGTHTAAKLAAARALGVPVVVIARPLDPAGPSVSTVDAALVWCRRLASPTR